MQNCNFAPWNWLNYALRPQSSSPLLSLVATIPSTTTHKVANYANYTDEKRFTHLPMKIFLRMHRPQQHHRDGFLVRRKTPFLALAGHFGQLIVVALFLWKRREEGCGVICTNQLVSIWICEQLMKARLLKCKIGCCGEWTTWWYEMHIWEDVNLLSVLKSITLSVPWDCIEPRIEIVINSWRWMVC